MEILRRTRVLRGIWLVALLALVGLVTGAGCGFEPDLGVGGEFACGAAGACPPDFVCAFDNKCYPKEKVPQPPNPTSDGGTADLYRDAVLADNPLAYWRLDETSGLVIDIGSAKQNGSVGAQVTRRVPGVLPNNSAIRNDGTAAAVTFGDVFDFPGTAAFSLEAWIKVQAVDGAYRAICGKKQAGATGFSFWVQAPDGLGFGRYIVVDGGEQNQDAVTAVIPSGWAHVVGTYDGLVMRLYVNGALASTSTKPNLSLPDRTNGFTIGAKGSDTPSYFNGDLDEIAIYDHAIGPARIAAHFGAAGK